MILEIVCSLGFSSGEMRKTEKNVNAAAADSEPDPEEEETESDKIFIPDFIRQLGSVLQQSLFSYYINSILLKQSIISGIIFINEDDFHSRR